METIKRITFKIKKYLIFYTLTFLSLGWILGANFSKFATTNKSIFSNVIVFFVFFMIYPMMINMDWKKITKLFKEPKAILLSLLYNYLITPIIAYILMKIFLHNDELALGFMLVMMIPVSSSSIGYTGIVKGSVEVATIAQTINFLLIPILAPIYLSIIAHGSKITLPMDSILKSMFYVIILPIILGYITRLIIISKIGEKGLKKIKPLIGLITLISMLGVIFFIFFLKGHMLVSKWHLLIILGGLTIIYLIIALVFETWFNKKAGLTYEEHMGIVFLSTGKNNGTAVAIATLAFSPLVAIPAAILPIFQIIFMIFYVKLEDKIKKYFEKNTKVAYTKKYEEE